ncbi:MAG: hypothetical protein ABIH46_02420 [Chloroflexota bacterium]
MTLSYDGAIVAKDQVGPLHGSAPARLTFEELKFIRLDFSRGIAVCEDGRLLDPNATRYEYSTFPTPFMAFQRVKYVAGVLRPAMPWEGPPVPRFTLGPRLRAHVVE